MTSTLFDPTIALTGGLLTSVAGSYIGIDNPIFAIMAATLG